MNWLHFGFILFGIYVVWFGYVLLKKQFHRALLLYGLAHVPYLLVNLVAPFRGTMDPEYLGYSFGLLQLPQGPLVPIVVGSIVVACFMIITLAFLNRLEGRWPYAFGVDLALTVLFAIPIVLGILSNPGEANLQLGEFLTLSGYVVALIVFVLFSGPTLWACYHSGKMTFKRS